MKLKDFNQQIRQDHCKQLQQTYSKKEIQVGIDVSDESKRVAILLLDGSFIEFSVSHRHKEFFILVRRLKDIANRYNSKVVIGIEGHQGYSSPLDRILLEAQFEVLNVNPVKLNRFRQLYGAPYSNDPYDAKLIAAFLKARALLQFGESQPLLPVSNQREIHLRIRLLARHQQDLIKEKLRLTNRLRKKLREYFPELLEGVSKTAAKWLLILLKNCPERSKLKKLEEEEISNFKEPDSYRIGQKKAKRVKELVKEIEFCSPLEEEICILLRSYASKILGLEREIKKIEAKIESLGKQSPMYQAVKAYDGVKTKISSRIVGETVSVLNFRKESSFSAYNGTGCLDDKSGKKDKNKKILLYNRRLNQAMRDFAACSIRKNPESRAYYDKKREEGKTHMHALKCLARQLSKKLYQRLWEVELAWLQVQQPVCRTGREAA